MATNRSYQQLRSTGTSQVFGDYRLERKIAQGGMAEAWKARKQGAAGVTRQVLIKRIKTSLSSDQRFVQMFISEAHVSASLSHGNIAQVFDFGEVQGEYYLAMEYVDGPSLAQLLKRLLEQERPALPPAIALFIAMEMCKGLHYAHTARDEHGKPLHIVHRDISPENVLVSYEGQVKLIDFGIAKARVAARPETEAGVVRGKFLYFSPEQSRGEAVDPQTDVWAVGVVLYFMLCGRLPVTGQAYDVIRKIQLAEWPKPRVVNPSLTEELELVVLKAMAGSKAARFRTCQQFHDALGEILHRDYPGISSAYVAAFLAEVFAQDLHEQGKQVDVSAPVKEGLEAMKTGQTRSRTYAPSPSGDVRPPSKEEQAVPAPKAEPLDATTKTLLTVLAGVLGLALLVGVGAYVAFSKPDEPVGNPQLPVVEEGWEQVTGKLVSKIKSRGATVPLQRALYPKLDELRAKLPTVPPDEQPGVEKNLAFLDAALGGPSFGGADRALFEEWLLSEAQVQLEQGAVDSAFALLAQCQLDRCRAARGSLEAEAEPLEGIAQAERALAVGDLSAARAGLFAGGDSVRFRARFEAAAAAYLKAAQLPSAPADLFAQDAKKQRLFAERLTHYERQARHEPAAFKQQLADVKAQALAAVSKRQVEAVDAALTALDNQIDELARFLPPEQQGKLTTRTAMDAKHFLRAKPPNVSAAKAMVAQCYAANREGCDCHEAAFLLHHTLKDFGQARFAGQRYMQCAPEGPQKVTMGAMLRGLPP